MINGAIFDVDGTLLDSMTMWRTFCSDLIRSFGKAPADDLDESVRYFTLKETCTFLSRQYDILTPEGVEKLAFERTLDFYSNKAAIKPGAADFCRMLKENGVRMYIASATYKELLEAALRRHGILDCFSGIITCPEVGSGKTKPDIFLAAMERIGTEVSDTWVFEDAMHAIKTAKSIGFRVFGMFDPTEADHRDEISSICDIYSDSFENYTIKDFQ